jgi:hypothetical protein
VFSFNQAFADEQLVRHRHRAAGQEQAFGPRYRRMKRFALSPSVPDKIDRDNYRDRRRTNRTQNERPQKKECLTLAVGDVFVLATLMSIP